MFNTLCMFIAILSFWKQFSREVSCSEQTCPKFSRKNGQKVNFCEDQNVKKFSRRHSQIRLGSPIWKKSSFWCPSSAVMIMIMMSSDAEKNWNYFFCISSVLSTTCCCIPFSAFSHFFPHSLEPIKTFFWHSIHFLQWILFLKTFLSCKTVLVSFIIYIFSRGRLWWWP